ncbi:MAG: family 43 glycosylhydrolase [Lachnospiraceae bacterium]|nr:family 43 glycosylhydrolase [Lachnospiraceae bacterium]
MKREDINIRDPFVLVHDGKYYLYGTRGATCWGEADGFDCYVGTDLEEFEGPFEVFHKPEEFAPHRNYWAPEVYEYNGAFYMFASFFTDGVGRGTHCLRAESPLGPFVPYSDGSLTPKEWASLDGTLYVDTDGTPYMVFCHEWEDTEGNGTVCAMELTKDLKAPVGKPRLLFRATDALPGVASFRHPTKGEIYVTDGPFLFRDKTGKLRMIWSSFAEGNQYCIALASPEQGNFTDDWKPEPELLFAKDGGHGMIFTGLDGKRYLALHSPNETLKERPFFYEVDL